MCEKIGVKYAAALVSGTAGLHLGLIMLGVKADDEVLCSNLTFAASANKIVYCMRRRYLSTVTEEPGSPASGWAVRSFWKKMWIPEAPVVVEV